MSWVLPNLVKISYWRRLSSGSFSLKPLLLNNVKSCFRLLMSEYILSCWTILKKALKAVFKWWEEQPTPISKHRNQFGDTDALKTASMVEVKSLKSVNLSFNSSTMVFKSASFLSIMSRSTCAASDQIHFYNKHYLVNVLRSLYDVFVCFNLFRSIGNCSLLCT